MPSTNFYNALAMARQNTEKLKQQKLAEINAASGALAKERMAAEDRKQRLTELDRNEMLQREQMALQSETRDKQLSNALEVAKIGAGTREKVAEQGNLTKKELEELKTNRAFGVEGMRGERAMDVEGMRQEGAGERLDRTLDNRTELETMRQTGQGERLDKTLSSREGISAADRASREGIAARRAELDSAKQDALEEYRMLTIAEQRADRTQRALIADLKQRAYEKYKTIDTELKISGDLLMPDEQKEALRARLNSSTVPLSDGPANSPASGPTRGLLETDEQDAPVEPFGVLQSDRNMPTDLVPPKAEPRAAPSPAPASPTSNTPDLKTKEGRVAYVKSIMRSLVARDKADGLTSAEIAAKNAAGEYDREAIKVFNEEGMQGKEPVGYVDQLGMNRGTPDGNGTTTYDQEALKSGPGLLARGAALPGKMGGAIAGSLWERGKQAVDVATGSAVAPARSAFSTVVENMPGISERDRADMLSKIAATRGTELSQLSQDVKGDSSMFSGPALANAAQGTLELAGGPILGKLGQGINWLTRGYAGKGASAIADLLRPAGAVLNRPLSDLSGKKAATEAAELAAAEAARKQAVASSTAQAGESGMARAFSNETDAAALGEQMYDDLYYQTYGKPAVEKRLMQEYGDLPGPDPNFQMAKPAPVQPVGVNQYGVKELPLDVPPSNQVIPLKASEFPGYTPPAEPLDMAQAMAGGGRVNMVGSQADEVANAAKLYPNPANYPDPLAYESGATKPFTSSFAEVLSNTPTTTPMPATAVRPGGGLGAELRQAAGGGRITPTPSQIDEMRRVRHGVLGEQMRGRDEKAMYDAMKTTYVPPPLADATEAFAAGNMRADIGLPSVVNMEAANAGIPASQLFQIMNEMPIDMLRGLDWTTPEGAKALIQAILKWRRLQ